MTQTTLTGERTEAKSHCGNTYKNIRGLKIHQTRSGFGRGITQTQHTDNSSVEEDPSLDTDHSAGNI